MTRKYELFETRVEKEIDFNKKVCQSNTNRPWEAGVVPK